MKRPLTGLCLAAALSMPVAAPVAAQDGAATVEFSVMTPETALKAAQATLAACREAGYQVGVSVVDRFGLTQVFLRDRFAGLHVEETAYRKAWTAISFRGATLELDEVMQPGTPFAGIRDLSLALPLGGGVPVEAAGSIAGAIGVSGAPTPEADDMCARAGVEAVAFDLEF